MCERVDVQKNTGGSSSKSVKIKQKWENTELMTRVISGLSTVEAEVQTLAKLPHFNTASLPSPFVFPFRHFLFFPDLRMAEQSSIWGKKMRRRSGWGSGVNQRGVDGHTEKKSF